MSTNIADGCGGFAYFVEFEHHLKAARMDNAHSFFQGGRMDKLAATFEENYPVFQYTVVEFVVEHLADLSRVFEGDLQEMLVLAIVGQVQMRAMRAAALAGEDPWGLAEERVSINASRIADVTAIPRETVRRKLRSLEQRGWVSQTANSAWRLAVDDGFAKAKLDLQEVDRRGIRRVARLFAGLEQIVPIAQNIRTDHFQVAAK